MVKNSKEDPPCSLFAQNISPVQTKAPLGQNETLITSTAERETEISGGSETAGNIPSLGKQVNSVI